MLWKVIFDRKKVLIGEALQNIDGDAGANARRPYIWQLAAAAKALRAAAGKTPENCIRGDRFRRTSHG